MTAALIAEARSWVGTPYQHQASVKGVGCDCLGLLRGVWRARIGPEPEAFSPYTPDWAEAGMAETLLQAAERHLRPVSGEPQGGHVLLFRWRQGLPAKHCAIAVSPSHFIHAHDGVAVTEVAFSPWWRRRLAGVFAFPSLSSDASE